MYNFASIMGLAAGVNIQLVAVQPGNVDELLCTYTLVQADLDDITHVVLSGHLNSLVNTLTSFHGYSSVLDTTWNPNDSIEILAPAFLGAAMNGQNLVLRQQNGGVSITQQFAGGVD